VTPEQTAADRIARAVERRTGTPDLTCLEIGRAGVEAMSAAGLVVLTAERAAQLLAAEREAERLRGACVAMDAGLSEFWPVGPVSKGHDVYIGPVDDAWLALRAALSPDAPPNA
jgi:hypothetical protein